MSDLPETIWVDYAPHTESYEHVANEDCGGYIKFRRDDLPITNAQLMADERVLALVEALENADRVLRHAADYWDNFCNDAERAPYTVAADQALAALAQLKEPANDV